MTLKVTLIQTSLFWENKKANLAMLEEKINSISEKTEVVILPEMFSTGFSMNAGALAEEMSGDTISWTSKMSAQKKIILTGSVIIKEENKFYNRLIWMLPNGEYGYYDKRHLFAYAQENQFYSAGNKRLITQVKGWKLNTQVCYDLRFPVWARQSFRHAENDSPKVEYDILLYVANWPAVRATAWKTLLKARAIENQCYVIGLNIVGEDGNNHRYDGGSMIIDPLGEIIYEAPNKEEVFTYTFDRDHLEQIRQKFPFLKDADQFFF
jgi:predicted amidohydrolase